MTRISDEAILRYLDGTLAADEQSDFAERLVSDPDLAARVERQEALEQAARESFRADLEEPVPDRWIAMIDAAMPAAQSGKLESLAAHRERRSMRWQGWHVGAAAAASLAIGLLLNDFGAQPLVREEGGVLIAGAPLRDALDGARSGVPVELASGGSLDVRLSLRNAQGRYCREAVVANSGAADHLLACREGEDWRVQGMIRSGGREGEYQTVAGDSPLDPLVDAMGGEMLDAAAETDAIRGGWSR
jgi:anti-sigma factor RsiW